VNLEEEGLLPSTQIALGAVDRLFPNGSRTVRPAAAVWDFTGVASGQPLYIFPPNSWAGVWPGFSTCSGNFASWSQTDPRLTGGGPPVTAPWVGIHLKSVRHRGFGSGHFATWNTNFAGMPTVWMSTADGITAQDTFWLGAGGHAHPSTGFSSPGLYAVSYDASGYLGAGQTNPVRSPEHVFHYAAGTYWLWQATHFAGCDWFTTNFSGELADPDRDGADNLTEYAHGLDPRKPDAHLLTNGIAPGLPALLRQPDGTLELLYRRRRASTAPQTTGEVLTAATLDAAAWTPVPLTGASVTIVDATWESVRLPLGALSAGSRRFFTLRTTLQPTPAY
jgi:surface-anchored protein